MKDISHHIPFAEKACEFLTNSPDPYHCVHNSVVKLEAAGYVQLSKRDAFTGKLEPGGKYYYTVNKTALVAFSVGPNYKAGNGLKVIGGKVGIALISVQVCIIVHYKKLMSNYC